MIKFVEVRDDYDKFINAIPSLASRTTALAKWIIYTINMKKVWRKIFIYSLRCFNPFLDILVGTIIIAHGNRLEVSPKRRW